MATRFKKEALKVLVRLLNEAEIHHLKVAFKELDPGNTGTISVQSLKVAMINLGYSHPSVEIDEMIKDMLFDENGQIDYTEFLAATLDVKQSFTREKLWAVFKHFAVDQNNYITLENLKRAMARSGRLLPEEDLVAMLHETDPGKQGKISFEQFCEIMMSEEFELNSPSPKRNSRELQDFSSVIMNLNVPQLGEPFYLALSKCTIDEPREKEIPSPELPPKCEEVSKKSLSPEKVEIHCSN
jgi:Ca2+-binding EF-hand superfamily protein